MTQTVKSILEADVDLRSKYVLNFEELRELVNVAKSAGYTIVLTQGVYDMWHVGHGRYLLEASSFGDILIVGVDSDELTRQMKGDNRPFDGFDERIEVLSMLSFVNIVTRRDVDQHMYDLIKLVEPDVLVMSKTTKSFTEKDKEVLAEFCGRIEHLEPKAPPESISTTAKVARLHREGAQSLADEIAESIQKVVDSHFGREDGDE